MLFSSITFLFYFLPLAIGFYYAALTLSLRAANIALLFLSLVFYFWGEREYIFLFLLSISFNYCLAALLSRMDKGRKALFIAGIVVNLAVLAYFKYSLFFVGALCSTSSLWCEVGFVQSIRLPLGISFFTFHGLSFLFDIYRQTVKFQPGAVNTGLYIALFPQLIAGPIVRYKEIVNQFCNRDHTIKNFSDGICRFIFGLAKKVLIADQLGAIVDYAFGLSPDLLAPGIAWLAIISYSLQIYFDFSGYSDMAIGLAKMFGFSFPENFNLPYTARSVREFWQRWHITLSNWFRDYLYIPLGGNRKSASRTAINLCIVFLLCGLWHGASWNFVLWGALHGLFIALERGKFGRIIERFPNVIQRAYLIVVVVLLWVPFRAENLSDSLVFWRALFGFSESTIVETYLATLIGSRKVLTLACAVFLGLGFHSLVKVRVPEVLKLLSAAVLLLLALAEIASGSYSPFIYFRF